MVFNMSLNTILLVLALAAASQCHQTEGQGGTRKDYVSLVKAAGENVRRAMQIEKYLKSPNSTQQRDLQQFVRNLKHNVDYYQSNTGLGVLKNTIREEPFEVSEVCLNQLGFWLTSLTSTEQLPPPWAVRMLDANFKLPAGIELGNWNWLGSYDECLDTEGYYSNGSYAFSGRHCSTIIPIIIPGSSIPTVPRLGTCLPNGCTAADVTAFLLGLLYPGPRNNTSNVTTTTMTTTTEEPVNDLNNPFYQLVNCSPRENTLDWRANVAIVICSLIIAMVLIGTTYDIVLVIISNRHLEEDGTTEKAGAANGHAVLGNEDSPQASFKSKLHVGEYTPLLGPQHQERKAPERQHGTLGLVLLAFSAYSNGRRLLATGNHQEGTLPVIHGVRFLSMCWVLLGHSYAFVLSSTSNLNIIHSWLKRFTFQAIDNAYYAVDSFFVLSGLLMIYLLMREKEKKNRINWAMFYIHRFWRLTPVYMLLLMVDVCLARYVSDGPMWPKETGFEVDFCKDTWWTNLLYVNNFIHTDKMCFGWSWYLAVDMQLFVVSPLIIIPLFYSKLIGMILMGLLMVTHLLTNSLLTHYYDVGTGGITDPRNPDFMKYIYFKPYTRLGPYVIGMLTGYLLYVCKGRFRVHKGLIAVMWVCAAALAILSLYGLVGTYNDAPLPEAWEALYNAFSRLSWSLALAWLIFACSTGNGGFVNTLLSWKAIVPLSRLTYCTYLVHPLVMYAFNFSTRSPMYMTDLTMTYLFLANFVASFGVAFVTSLLFESPMMGLEKALWRK